jgi:hypothetical protein
VNAYIYPGIISIKPSVELLDRTLYAVTGVTFEEAKSNSRKDENVLYRTLYWHFLNKHYKCNFKGLGKIFNRDKATARWGLEKCKNEFDYDLLCTIKRCEELFLRSKIVASK